MVEPTGDEAAFLAEYDVEAFERPSVTVDVVILTVEQHRLRVVLVQRDAHPHAGRWALPGGFVGVDESLESAAERVLRDKAGIEDVYLEQLYTFGAVDRDPRTRVITVAYYALVDAERLRDGMGPENGRRLAVVEVPWEGEAGGAVAARTDDDQALDLAFDHAEVIGLAVKRIRGKLDYVPIGYQLLPDEFLLRDLQEVHETVLGRSLVKHSFRRRMLGSGEIEPTGRYEGDVDHRPAEFYRFTHDGAV